MRSVLVVLAIAAAVMLRDVPSFAGDGPAAGPVKAAGPFLGVKIAAKFTAPPGSPLPKATAAFTATTAGPVGPDVFRLKAKKLSKTAAYKVFIESGVGTNEFFEAGDLTASLFAKDTSLGDALPLGAVSITDYIGRTIQIRDGTDVVVSGVVPQPKTAYGLAGWPLQRVFTFIPSDASKPRYVRVETGTLPIYRAEYDPKKESVAKLRKIPEAVWDVTFVALVPDGVLCAMRLVSDERVWWSSAPNGGGAGQTEHILRTYTGINPPGTLDAVRFIVRRDAGPKGTSVYRVESVLYPGEFLTNAGNNLAGNGILISHAGVGDNTFLIR